MDTATERPSWREKNRILVAVFPNEEAAKHMVNVLVDKNFQMDLISVLGRIHGLGDDTLGIYHLNPGERLRTWGKQGAFWGGIWGLMAGAAGFFIIPGVGAVAAAGYVVEGLVGGALLGGGAMAGAAALSQLGVTFHRAGIPEAEVLALHKAIEEGKYLVMLRGAESEVSQWREVLLSGKPLKIHDLPYSRMMDKQ